METAEKKLQNSPEATPTKSARFTACHILTPQALVNCCSSAGRAKTAMMAGGHFKLIPAAEFILNVYCIFT